MAGEFALGFVYLASLALDRGFGLGYIPGSAGRNRSTIRMLS